MLVPGGILEIAVLYKTLILQLREPELRGQGAGPRLHISK